MSLRVVVSLKGEINWRKRKTQRKFEWKRIFSRGGWIHCSTTSHIVHFSWCYWYSLQNICLECVPISTTITSSVVCQAVDDALRFQFAFVRCCAVHDCCWWSFKINVPNPLSCNLCVKFVPQLLHENTFELYGSWRSGCINKGLCLQK